MGTGPHDGKAYRIKPSPVVETVTMYSTFPAGYFGPTADTAKQDRTHALTFTTRDGEPATGRYVNEAGDVITLEQIGEQA